MNKKKLINFLLKYILPPILIIIYFTISGYLKTGIIAPLSWDILILFLGLFFVTSFFWAMTEAVQISFEDFLSADWKGKIVFILIAIFLIVLYKISGRI
ncbi:hypothetical protein [uncultured Fusobacterium sp.]|uniref:hypothetical protein n=1 Tax=uncultured Fusobacterium sp. TaxID=159267 RepID=UPI002620AF6D|nr:hypothetical protein [uncultured Fusobacterium sp.]